MQLSQIGFHLLLFFFLLNSLRALRCNQSQGKNDSGCRWADVEVQGSMSHCSQNRLQTGSLATRESALTQE